MDFERLQQLIDTNIWSYSGSNPDTVVKDWTSSLNHIITECIPIHTYTPNPTKPWLNKKIRNRIRKKNQLYKKAINSKRPEDWDRYKKQRKSCCILTKNAEKIYIQDLSKLPHNKFWSYLSYKNKQSSPYSSISSKNSDVATEFNNYFSSVYESNTDCNVTIDAPSPPRPYIDKLTDIMCSESEVYYHLSNLPSKTSSGPDKLSSILIKILAPSLTQPLTELYNYLFKHHYFPDEWKIARIVPVFKKGDSSKVENYRPISVLNIISKIFEKIINSRITQYFETNLLFQDSQIGFRSNFSTSHHIVGYLNDLIAARDAKLYSISSFIDFKRAFDLVWQNALLVKLAYYGVGGNVLLLLKSFFTNRYQFVTIDDLISDIKRVTSGVVQGSVLGPTLFLIFINDLIYLLKEIHVRLFADDTIIYISGQDPHMCLIKLQEALLIIQNWCIKWKLPLNIDKCATIFTSNGSSKSITLPPLTLFDMLISPSPNYKYLGITLKSDLKWDLHIYNIESSAKRKIGFLFKCFPRLDPVKYLLIYKSHIRPILEYACQSFGDLPAVLNTRLELIQERFLRKIYNVPSTVEYCDLLAASRLPTLKDRRNYLTVLLFNHIINLPDNNVVMAIPPTSGTISGRTTRSSKDLALPKPNTELFKKSFQYHAAKLWNSLTPIIRDLSGSPQFDKAVRTFFYI